MVATSTAQKKQKGSKLTLAAVLSSAVLWATALPAVADIVNSVVAKGTVNTTEIKAFAEEHVDVADQVALIALNKVGVLNDANANSIADPGETVSYSFTIENTGNVTLKNVVLTDTKVTPTAFSPASLTLAPHAIQTASASYVLTTTDLNAGLIINTARVDATTIPGLAVSAADTETTLLVTSSPITLDKTASLILGNGVADVGDIISYQFKVTNTGPTTLTNVSVADPLLLVADLPGAGRVQDLIQLASIPSDPITTASITVASLGPEPREPATWKQPLPQWPAALSATRKLVNLSGTEILKTGDRVGVYLTLTNSGDVPLTNLSVSQPGDQAFGSALEILAPNTSDSASVIFTHILTDEDVITGQIIPISGVVATAGDRTLIATLGEPLSLLDIEMPDDIATASISPAIVGTLEPGAETIFTASYQLTQVDIDAGHVANSATASGTNTVNGIIKSTDAVDTPVPQAPAIELKKTAALNLGTDNTSSVGDIVTYSFTLTNTGNTTLDDVRVADPMSLAGLTISLAEFDNFKPGDQKLFTGTYALKQADIEAGKVENQATASGLPKSKSVRISSLSDDPTTPAAKDKTILKIPQAPKIALVKQIGNVADTNNTGFTDAGDIVTYTFKVKNEGNVPLTDVYVKDRDINVISNRLPPTGVTLAAGAENTASFTATYVLRQADADRGFYDNTADVFGTASDKSIVKDESDPAVYLKNAPTHLEIVANPALAVLKPQPAIVQKDGNTTTDLGDVLNYTIKVINVGNVTLNNVVVTDPKVNNFTTTIPTLLPGAVYAISVPVSYIVTLDDVKAGQVENTAFAEAKFKGTPVGDQSDTSNIAEDNPTITSIVPRPAIALVKPQPEISDINFNGVTDEGDQLIYTFVVTNTGNVDLDTFKFTDAMGPVVSTRTTVLEAGDADSTSFTLTYTLVTADITRGTVTNTADVVALSPTRVPARDTSDVSTITGNRPTVTTLANLIDPKIAILKQATTTDANHNGIIDKDDIIDYVFSVTNTGNVALSNVAVTDPKLALEGNVISPNSGVIGTLARGVTVAGLTAHHLITQDDVDAGAYDNQALVTSKYGSATVKDLSDGSSLTADKPTVVSMAQLPAIAVIKGQPTNKDKNGNGTIDAGDELTYSFEIHNVGNTTLFNVSLTDNNADIVTGLPIASLAPGAADSTTFKATRKVTDADAVAGKIVNSATVRAALINGGVLSVSDISDATSVNGREPTETVVAIVRPVLSKTAARSTLRRGERMEYTIAATNLGSGPYDVADIMPPGFTFVPGSATLNGVAITPVRTAKTLTFANITPDVRRRLVIKLSLMASASNATGDFVNRARIYTNSTGQFLAEAQARVTIKEEAIFDCGEIIGRVFDDVNSNGYMDDGEVGLPGVRVVTVKGLLVTTDAYGRFHITCADVPNAQIGSNFLMKLDTRTLPAGYALTSENPRDVRLTRGKITKLNFGASKQHDVGLDLTREAFGAGLDLRPHFVSGVDRLVSLLSQSKSQLTITYRCGAYAPIADERLVAVEQLIQAKWKKEGGNKPLKITKRVECGK
jgi:uncharacterized repeat protein (TIGR01451 family)